MRRFFVCFLLVSSVNLWANQSKELQADTVTANTTQMELNPAVNSIETEQIVDEMKQNSKSTVTKYISIATCVLVGVLILMAGVIVYLLYKIYKTLRNIESAYKQADNRRNKCSRSLDVLTDKVDKIAKNVETKAKYVASDMKNYVTIDKPDLQKQEVEETGRKKAETGEKMEISPKPQKEKSKCIYAKPLTDGCLRTTEAVEEMYYVISMQEGNATGKFRIYENEEQKVKAINYKEGMLDKFCEAKNSSIDAKSIKNLRDGEVEPVRNGMWRVKKKAEIEFIK